MWMVSLRFHIHICLSHFSSNVSRTPSRALRRGSSESSRESVFRTMRAAAGPSILGLFDGVTPEEEGEEAANSSVPRFFPFCTGDVESTIGAVEGDLAFLAASTSPHATMDTRCFVFPDWDPHRSSAFTTFIPSTTEPNTTCFPLRNGVASVVIKNCDPFVFSPAFAIDRSPGRSCFSLKFSSLNSPPYMLSPPVPLPRVKSPPWIMNPGMIRWNTEPLKWRGFFDRPRPISPVHKARKFSAVLGTTSPRSSNVILWGVVFPICTSKKTLERGMASANKWQ
mmetsp:Transcript_15108/g.20256  ORF Transcript_15108/g.20256 Transcript_15108/m.20256 type:complete len:281 (+) Transcript_15108:580-1422(+)